MLDDFKMILTQLPIEQDFVNIYAVGDVHVGSPNFSEDIWYEWKKLVMKDPNARVVIVGDMLDNGLKNSKTNVYFQKYSPFEQKEWAKRELGDFRDKIIGAVTGNHEGRGIIEVGSCPLYDVFAKLDLEDSYRENMAFIKVSLGEKRSDRQYAYNVVLGHGKGKVATEKFAYTIDGMDVLVTGHLHGAGSTFPAKIVIDPRNEVVTIKGFAHVKVPSFQTLGGYALRDMYQGQDPAKFPIIRLGGTKKEVSVIWV